MEMAPIVKVRHWEMAAFRCKIKINFDIFAEVTDPVGDVMRFVHQFEETYGSVHPVFYQGSYGQAISDAKQELRFLLVYIHQDNNKNCQDFCR